jgi:hypothetical protein
MHRDPVHPGGLHHYHAYATAHQPLRHFYQRSGPRPELAHRLRVPPARYGYVVAFVSDINARRVSVHNLQSRICGTQTLFDISALFAIQSRPEPQPIKGGYDTGFPAGSRSALFSERRSRHQTMDCSNRNQTFERAQWHQADCDHGCRASLLESATALWHSASFRYYGPAKGGHETLSKFTRPADSGG